MTEKIVTIIVPTYNMEKYIGRCIESAIIPSIESIEVIVVNDGSTDNSHEIASEYADKYPDSIRVIDKENGHYGTTINAGLKVARGKYMRIMDADDYFEEGALEKFVQLLANCDTDLVVTAKREELLEDGKFRLVRVENVEYGKVYDYPSFRVTDYSTWKGEFNMHTMTCKTALLRECGLNLPGGVCYTDMIYCMQPLDRIKTLVIYDLVLYHYNIGREGSSTTQQVIKRNLKHICTVLTYMLDYCEQHPSTEIIQANRNRHINEAFDFFLNSIMRHDFVGREEYELVCPILYKIKKLNIKNKRISKYYIKPWVENPSLLRLNFWLTIYKIGHPLK